MYKLKKGCKRLYRCYDTEIESMQYTHDYYSAGVMMDNCEFYDHIFLMEGIEIGKLKLYEGDIFRNIPGSGDAKAYDYSLWVLSQDKFGRFTFSPIREDCAQLGYFNLTDFKKFKKVGNVFENPELLQGGGKS